MENQSCPPGAIGLEPAELDFVVEEGWPYVSEPRFIKVVNIGPPGSLTPGWNAKTVDWIKFSPHSGQTGQSILVRVDLRGRPAGDYEAQMEFDSPTATNTPQYATIKAKVTPKPKPLQIVTASLPNGVVGQPYSAQIEAQGGVLPYTWGSSGLPDGLSLDQNGWIIGIPVLSDSFSVAIMVQDADGNSVTAQYTLDITATPPSPLTISIISPAGGEVWHVGETHKIKWLAQNGDGKTLNIDLICGGVPYGIAAGVPVNDGEYSWTILNEGIGETDTIRLSSDGVQEESQPFAVRKAGGCAPFSKVLSLFKR